MFSADILLRRHPTGIRCVVNFRPPATSGGRDSCAIFGAVLQLRVRKFIGTGWSAVFRGRAIYVSYEPSSISNRTQVSNASACVRWRPCWRWGLRLRRSPVHRRRAHPTYARAHGPNGSWVLGNGQIITPAGKQVALGPRVRAKAVALNPDPTSHTAAVLTMGASQAVEVFDTLTGVVLQNYLPSSGDSSGSYSGIAYSADGKCLLFSQDSSNIAIAKVLPTGLFDAGRSACRRTTVSSRASRTARSATTAGPAARSIRRALRIRAASRSPATARAHMLF